MFFPILSWVKILKEQFIWIKIIWYIINAFIVTFDQFNASLLYEYKY